MCWLSVKQDIKVAEQDIPIFKIMRKTSSPEMVKSIYQNFLYTLNSLTESHIKIKSHWSEILFEVNEALHSYNPEKIKCLRNYLIINIEVPNCFYGLPKKLDWFDVDKDIIRVEGIIPKGSKYMENIDGEYVSNQLILKYIEYII